MAACPEEWLLVIELDASGSADVAGDNTDAMGGYRAGSCGGGGATNVYSFVAPADGMYVLSMDAEDLDPEDDIRPDTVLFAHSLCDFDQGTLGRDIDCNDDRFVDPNDPMNRDLLSRIQVPATNGQTIYVFADSYTSEGGQVGWRGAYTLSIRLAAPPTLNNANAYVNADRGTMGVVVEGIDSDPAYGVTIQVPGGEEQTYTGDLTVTPSRAVRKAHSQDGPASN